MSQFQQNFNSKKIRYKMDCYILHTVLFVTLLLFVIIFFINMQNIDENKKKYCCTNSIKMQNIE